MIIHTVNRGETVYEIARKYGISPMKIIENNKIRNTDMLIVGEELLILFPTRTHTVLKGETLDGICKRFSVSKESLKRNNPQLLGADSIYQQEVLAIKYQTPPHGIMLTNGYVYNGCKSADIAEKMPYFNYVTFSPFVIEKGKIRQLFDFSENFKMVKENRKRAFIRFFLKDAFSDGSYCETLINEICEIAKKYRADGITLAGAKVFSQSGFSDFLMKLKYSLLTENTQLYIECAQDAEEIYTDIADGCIMIYDRCADPEKIPSFEEECKVFKSYAEKYDSLKTFVDISPFAYGKDFALPISEAKISAQREKAEISYADGETILKMKTEKGKEIIYPSLKGIKAKLELLNELGFAGVSLDIMRCPTEHLMLINSDYLFADGYIYP